MRRNLLSLAVLAIAICSIVSCSHPSPGIAIPKNASLAVHINTTSITSKVTWQEIQQNEWFKKLYAGETDSLSKKIMNDPTSSGVDLKADLAFFTKQESHGSYAAIEGGIKDAAAFEAFAVEANKGGKVAKSGDVNVLNTGNRSLVAWTNNRFVYIMDATTPGFRGRLDVTRPDVSEPYAYKTDSLQKFAVQLFDLPNKENLMTDDRFASLLKETGDIHYWVNAEAYYNSLGGYLSLLKMNVLFEDNAYGAALNFENGKITLKSRAYYNKDLKDMINKYSNGKVSEAMINRIPSKNVVAVFAFKYPPAALKDLFKLVGVDGFVNSFFNSEGFSTDEFIKANKGDMLISVSDFEIKSKALTLTDPDSGEQRTIQQDRMPSANILFATSVNDKPAFDKLLGILQKQSQQLAPLTNDIHFQLNNEWFAAGNSPEQINAFLSGGNNQFPFTSRISGKAIGGYIDLQKLLQAAASSVKDSSVKAAMDASIGMWQDVVMTGGGDKDGAFLGDAEINLVDKNTNSLKQLNKYLDVISRELNIKHGNQYDAQVLPGEAKELPSFAMIPVLPSVK